MKSNNIIDLARFLEKFTNLFPEAKGEDPWVITGQIQHILTERIKKLNDEYSIHNNIAIHRSARIEDHSIVKAPAIISSGCFIAAHAYLRGGIFLDENVTIGPGCEVKSSIIFAHSTLAHFNFVGDSLVGSHVNLEAGAVIANHHNDRLEKTIFIGVDGKRFSTGIQKFGAVVGDYTKIGANAVLSPGTILPAKSIVKRLSLIEQC